MNEIFYTLLVFVCGIIIGFIFFGGLWLTVKRITKSKTPGLLFIASFFLRMAFALFGFYYLAAGSFKNIMACLIGFTLARFIMKYIAKSQKEKVVTLKEAPNES